MRQIISVRDDAAGIAAHWWIPLVRGIVALAFGVLLFARPVSAVGAFVILFGAFAFVDGILAIVQAVRFTQPGRRRWWMGLLTGIAGIAIGLLTFFTPGLTAYFLGLYIAAWAIVTGIFEIGAAFRLRRDVPGELFLLAAGVFSLALGIALFFFPLAALLAWVWVVGTYAIVAGIALIALSVRLRRRAGRGAATA